MRFCGRERDYVPRVLCSQGPMFPGSYVFYVPRFVCDQGTQDPFWGTQDPFWGTQDPGLFFFPPSVQNSTANRPKQAYRPFEGDTQIGPDAGRLGCKQLIGLDVACYIHLYLYSTFYLKMLYFVQHLYLKQISNCHVIVIIHYACIARFGLKLSTRAHNTMENRQR